MPDYPDDTCKFYRTVDESSDQIILEEIEDSTEEVKGWDVAINDLIKEEKYRVRTFILQ